ncbi:MAG: tyrosine-type recombinase/integrase [Pseudomonadota bacterium]
MSYRIYRRPGSPNWNVAFTVNGDRVRRSLRTSDEDVANIRAADQHRRALIGHITGEKETISLDHAFGRYVMEVARFQSSFATTRHQAKPLLRIIGKTTLLAAIDDARISAYKAKRRGERARRGKSPKKGRGSVQMDRLVSNATVNREMELLRRLMNTARRDWKLGVGEVDWQRHLLEESDGNTRWLTPHQVEKVLAVAPVHLKPPLIAAICTGLRSQNVMHLDWKEIDLSSRLITVRVKSRKPGGKVLNIPIAQPLLAELANIGPRDAGRVFLYGGRPIKTDVRRAFLSACRKAKIGGPYTWHDLRHTAASWMRQRKVPIETVKEILGHSDIRLTMRYAHIGEEAHVEAVDAIGAAFGQAATAAECGTPVAQAAVQRRKKG